MTFSTSLRFLLGAVLLPLALAVITRHEALLAMQPESLVAVARTRPNPYEALQWYEYAAKLNHPPAMVALAAGNLARKPRTKGSLEKGLKWYRRAAEKGNEIASYELSTLYSEGKIVEKNVTRARVLLEESTASGRHLAAMYNLASLLEDDTGPEERLRAIDLFNRTCLGGKLYQESPKEGVNSARKSKDSTPEIDQDDDDDDDGVWNQGAESADSENAESEEKEGVGADPGPETLDGTEILPKEKRLLYSKLLNGMSDHEYREIVDGWMEKKEADYRAKGGQINENNGDLVVPVGHPLWKKYQKRFIESAAKACHGLGRLMLQLLVKAIPDQENAHAIFSDGAGVLSISRGTGEAWITRVEGKGDWGYKSKTTGQPNFGIAVDAETTTDSIVSDHHLGPAAAGEVFNVTQTEVLGWFTRAVDYDNTHGHAAFNAAMMYYNAGRKKKARKYCKLAVKQNISSAHEMMESLDSWDL